MISDSLQEIWFSLTRNKLRTSLTAFGVFWGLFMLALLLGAGSGVMHSFELGFSRDLRNSVRFYPMKTSVPFKGLALARDVKFTEADIGAIMREIPGVGIVSGESSLGQYGREAFQITYENKSDSFEVYGVATDYFKIKVFQEYRAGRRLNNLDNYEQRKVVTIGTRVAERYFEAPNDAIGKQLNINGVSFTVVGVFYDSGLQGRMSERVYVPLSTFQGTFGANDNYLLIKVAPKKNVTGDEITKPIVNLLSRRHNIAPNDQRAIRVQDLGKEMAAQIQNFLTIKLFIWIVGIGTLAAGVVGISNVMIITVKERTMEIGIRKALGAKPISIVTTILLEASLVTVIAGYAGLVLGVGCIELVNYGLTSLKIDLMYFVNPRVDFNAALGALLVLVSSGIIAGFFPAWKAAKISPIEAMRAR